MYLFIYFENIEETARTYFLEETYCVETFCERKHLVAENVLLQESFCKISNCSNHFLGKFWKK